MLPRKNNTNKRNTIYFVYFLHLFILIVSNIYMNYIQYLYLKFEPYFSNVTRVLKQEVKKIVLY